MAKTPARKEKEFSFGGCTISKLSPGLRLLQDGNDLLFGESTASHMRSSWTLRLAKVQESVGQFFGGGRS